MAGLASIQFYPCITEDELVSFALAFPTGKAKAIRMRLHRRGEILPTDQQLVFPQSLSCHDTSTTMTCNQDFGLGFFKLARNGSRSA